MSDRIEQIRERLSKRATGKTDVFQFGCESFNDMTHLLSTVDALREEVEEGRKLLEQVHESRLDAYLLPAGEIGSVYVRIHLKTEDYGRIAAYLAKGGK